jgi:hypothetical protein
MTEATTKHRGRKLGSKNKKPRIKRVKNEKTELQLVNTTAVQEPEDKDSFSRKLPIDMGMSMAYPISNLLRPAIPTIEEFERTSSDLIATITFSIAITKRILNISKRNPAIIASLHRNGLDPSFLDGGYIYNIKDIVMIQRVTGEQILRS